MKSTAIGSHLRRAFVIVNWKDAYFELRYILEVLILEVLSDLSVSNSGIVNTSNVGCTLDGHFSVLCCK